MARPLAKRKRKQQMPKVSFKKRKEKLHKKVVVKGNALIAANWDSTQTLSQKYAHPARPSLLGKLESAKKRATNR